MLRSPAHPRPAQLLLPGGVLARRCRDRLEEPRCWHRRGLPLLPRPSMAGEEAREAKLGKAEVNFTCPKPTSRPKLTRPWPRRVRRPQPGAQTGCDTNSRAAAQPWLPPGRGTGPRLRKPQSPAGTRAWSCRSARGAGWCRGEATPGWGSPLTRGPSRVPSSTCTAQPARAEPRPRTWRTLDATRIHYLKPSRPQN